MSVLSASTITESSAGLQPAQWRAVFHSLVDAMFVADSDGRLIDANRAALALFRETSLGALQQRWPQMHERYALSPPGQSPLLPEQWPVPCLLRGEPVRGLRLSLRHLDTDETQTLLIEGALTGDTASELVVLTVRNVTDQFAAPIDPQRTAELLQAVANETTDAVFVKDVAGRYLFCNTAAAQFIGKPLEEILGYDDSTLFAADSVPVIRAHDRRVIDRGETITAEETIESSGVMRTYLATKAPYRDATGRIVGLIGISRDISDRKRADNELRQMLEFQNAIIRTASEGICVRQAIDEFPFVRFTLWNERMTELTGYTREEINELGWYQSVYVDPDARERALARMRRMEAGEHLRSELWEITRKDGTRRLLRVSTSPITLADGGRATAAIMLDETERQRVVDELQSSERRFRALIEHGFEGMTVFDARGGIKYSSPANQKQLGYQAGEVPGGFGLDFIHPGDQDRARATLAQALQHPEQVLDVTIRVRHKLGDWRWIEFRVCNLLTLPAVEGLVANWRDVTARKTAEDTLRHSERRFRTLAENAGDAIFLHDADGRILDVNQTACKSLGYSREELIGLMPFDFDPHVTPEQLQNLLAHMEAGESVTFETVHRRLDRTEFPVEVRLSPFRIDGRINSISVVHDITERKVNEAALRSSEERYRNLVELSPDVIGLIQEGRLVYVNSAGARMMRAASSAEMNGLPINDYIHPDDLAESLERQRVVLQEQRMLPLHEVRLRRLDGTDLVAETCAGPCLFNGRPAVQLMARDVTERKRQEEILRLHQQRLLESQRIARLGSWTWDPDTDAVWWSEQIYELFGLEPGTPPLDYEGFLSIIHSDDRDDVRKVISEIGERADHDYRIVRPDGEVRWLRSVATTHCDEAGRLLRVEGIDQDITERKLAEEQYRESQRMIAAIANASPLTMYVVDIVDRTIVYANRDTAQDLGYSEAQFREVGSDSLFKLLHPDDASRLPEFLARWTTADDGQLFESEYRLLHADGHWHWFISRDTVFTRDAAGRVRQIIGTAQDVTDRKRLEQQFLQAQKMDAIGRLSGGIAHDFNNLLTIINGYSELLAAQPSLARNQQDMVAAVRDAGQRAARLTKQLLSFSRQSLMETQSLELNSLVQGAERLFRRLIGETIRFSLILSPEPLPFRGNAGQLEQVLMNLVLNARDAMPDGGKLSLTTSGIGSPVESVELTVSDTGCGIAADVLPRIFDPFFSTKAPVRGTGLGLAVVHGVVQQCGGTIEIESVEGQGSTFRLRFPRVVAAEADVVAPQVSDRPSRAATILLVEDDPGVLEYSRQTLATSGFRVFTAADGASAEQLVASHGGKIHLLVTDVVMPDLSGRELAERLRVLRPGLPVLFVSGYTDDAILHHGVQLGYDSFLQKPFTPAELTARVLDLIHDAD
jgi:two-component system cell cycle sensor histidine kinase/response regulator CckA